MNAIFDEDDRKKKLIRRVNQMDAVVVAHDALRASIEGIKECVAWSESAREPLGALLTGDGGVGKTTVCRAILQTYRPYESFEPDCAVRIVPAYFASIPEPSTIKSVSTSLLRGLGDPAPERGSAMKATARLVKLLERCKTKLILLDEFQHLLLKGQQRTEQHVCDWIKALVNESGVMICLIGVPDCEDLIKSDEQLGRRFAMRFRLSRLAVGDVSSPGPLMGFLRVLSGRCKDLVSLNSILEFDGFPDVLRVHIATRGNPAQIVLLFKHAMLNALSCDREDVRREDFAASFAKGVTLSVALSTTNPFTLTDNAVARLVAALDRRGL
jgi:type II secretory pathway predicted ATPase ExeA